MGKLLDLAKAVAGEKTLHGRFGRWILAVSQALDVQGGEAPLEFIQVGYANQQTLTVGDTLVPDEVLIRSGIAYAGGSFRLSANKKYRLVAHGEMTQFNDDVGGEHHIAWFDDTGVQYGTEGVFMPMSNTSQANSNPHVEAIASLRADTAVHLQVTSSSGSARTAVGAFSVSIVEIR